MRPDRPQRSGQSPMTSTSWDLTARRQAPSRPEPDPKVDPHTWWRPAWANGRRARADRCTGVFGSPYTHVGWSKPSVQADLGRVFGLSAVAEHHDWPRSVCSSRFSVRSADSLLLRAQSCWPLWLWLTVHAHARGAGRPRRGSGRGAAAVTGERLEKRPVAAIRPHSRPPAHREPGPGTPRQHSPSGMPPFSWTPCCSPGSIGSAF
jgi:hypothetical protein